jgi:hypothetical protein
VLDGVGVVWENLLKELLEVVRGQSRLTLAAAYDSHGANQNGAACLLVDAAVIVGRGCSLLAALFAPLLAVLLVILDDDIGRCYPTAAWGWVKLGRLVANGVMGSDATQLLSGVLDGVDRCLERP